MVKMAESKFTISEERQRQLQLSIEETVTMQLQAHPKYSKAVGDAVHSGNKLILDYHSHKNEPEKYCVSIRKEPENSGLQILGQNNIGEELAHIKFGASKDECKSLMSILAEELKKFYNLEYIPTMYFQGEPLR